MKLFEREALFYCDTLGGPKGQLDWKHTVLLFEGYRCRHNFKPFVSNAPVVSTYIPARVRTPR